MEWKVMVGSTERPWETGDEIALDPPSGWAEAWDEIVPGYRAQRYASEHEANAVATRLRALGLTTATDCQ